MADSSLCWVTERQFHSPTHICAWCLSPTRHPAGSAAPHGCGHSCKACLRNWLRRSELITAFCHPYSFSFSPLEQSSVCTVTLVQVGICGAERAQLRPRALQGGHFTQPGSQPLLGVSQARLCRTGAQLVRRNLAVLIYQIDKILSSQLRGYVINCVLITAAATSSECSNLQRNRGRCFKSVCANRESKHTQRGVRGCWGWWQTCRGARTGRRALLPAILHGTWCLWLLECFFFTSISSAAELSASQHHADPVVQKYLWRAPCSWPQPLPGVWRTVLGQGEPVLFHLVSPLPVGTCYGDGQHALRRVFHHVLAVPGLCDSHPRICCGSPGQLSSPCWVTWPALLCTGHMPAGPCLPPCLTLLD